MTDLNHYIPRCRICGALHSPCHLETAMQVCAAHRINHPNHRPQWVPTKSMQHNNKEQNK